MLFDTEIKINKNEGSKKGSSLKKKCVDLRFLHGHQSFHPLNPYPYPKHESELSRKLSRPC